MPSVMPSVFFTRSNVVRMLCLGGCLALLSSCMPSQGSGRGESFTPYANEGAQAACEARGGDYAAAGLGGSLTCIERPKDAGKSCSASSECESACLARSRTCAPIAPLFGCHSILDFSGREVTLCRD